MKVEELRIGNWIFGDNDPYMQVEQLFKTGIIANFPEAESDGWEYDTERVSPIPLTPKILKASGFTKETDSEFHDVWWTKNRFGISYAKMGNEVTKKGSWYVGDYTEIPNLHWLQNYYFFTTGGKELEIAL